MLQSLNENIKALRVAQGLSQVELARALCVSKQCVSNWENDNIQPSIEMLIKIADYFRVSCDALLGRERGEQIDLCGLSGEQAAHIRQLVSDLCEANKR